MAPPENFKPALIIVDLQEDFCPPNGSLAVPNGRDIIPIVNSLLKLPFNLKIATKDWHPADHISFASNHPNKQPFSDFAIITNPNNPDEKYESRLWPIHCVQNTPGAALVAELDISKIDKVIEKGMRKEVEMYSAFYDPLKSPRCSDSGLAGVLRENGVTDVYCVGLAFDYCVKATAVDARREGFRTWVVKEGTRAVDGKAWGDVESELKGEGVECVDVGGEEVGWVRGLTG
ncbi:isochorismatase [Acephala macrosclerotiorum]|nr:isochorismatase [Acephala macrosclerotiorum]